MTAKLSPSVQDYLKALYLEGEDLPDGPSGLVSTAALAHRLELSAASATNMLKRLGSLGLVEHVPYRGAALTAAGREAALEVIRHHRLLETYLSQRLGVPWERVHEEAEVLEHVLSEDLEERISAHLGNPTVDPHGHPIPTRDLQMPSCSEVTLWEVPDGGKGTVTRVSDERPEALRYMAQINIKPGAAVEVTGRGPVDGPLFVTIGDRTSGATEALSREMAESIWVS
ncbi:metal-dependent transcriptional regulator [soil metagenome]